MAEAVITSDDLFRDINATFLSTYRNVVGANVNLPQVMRLGVASGKRRERYGYVESPPVIERIDRGEGIVEDAYKAIAYTVENLTWGKAIGFHEEDIEDFQLGDLRDMARKLATRAAQLSEQVFFQILQATASAILLKAIPTAPDGAALYATTAAGAARFGATNGNLLTGTGVATSGAVRSDFWNMLEQFKLFQDTEGEPLLTDAERDSGITLVYGAANEEVFREAFIQGRTVDRGGAVGVSNTILESGVRVSLWSTQRISTNDWFGFLSGVEPRPIFEQVRRAPRMMDETRENSERARRFRMLSTLLDMRAGFGISLPYATIQMNN